MGSVNSIREELLTYMNRNQMIHSHFAELSGLNSGTLSRILKVNIQSPWHSLLRLLLE